MGFPRHLSGQDARSKRWGAKGGQGASEVPSKRGSLAAGPKSGHLAARGSSPKALNLGDVAPALAWARGAQSAGLVRDLHRHPRRRDPGAQSIVQLRALGILGRHPAGLGFASRASHEPSAKLLERSVSVYFPRSEQVVPNARILRRGKFVHELCDAVNHSVRQILWEIHARGTSGAFSHCFADLFESFFEDRRKYADEHILDQFHRISGAVVLHFLPQGTLSTARPAMWTIGSLSPRGSTSTCRPHPPRFPRASNERCPSALASKRARHEVAAPPKGGGSPPNVSAP